tara:strand:- start:5058 stop:5291 length:234 start_codon:yes stop_codon:yes gene_type:complete
MTSDPIINQVDEEFSLKLTKLIKNYVIDLVNHEVDVITDSDWFTEKIQNAVKDNTDNYEPTDEEMMSSFGTKWHDAL